MYALMAVGLTLVYGLLRILHIAHAGVFVLGAYMAVVTANATGSLALGFLLAAVVSAVAGAAIYRLAYQPILAHSAFVPMVVSIGLFVVMQEAFRLVFGATSTRSISAASISTTSRSPWWPCRSSC
jgi:branched-chain amino acid transport system permease protein